MNIATFIEWFITQFIRIGTYMIGKLDNITLYGSITLLDFIITIAIISIFISIVITAPQLGVVNRALNQKDREIRRQKYTKKGNNN